MRGARKVWGFVSTWLSVLFAPWIFAAQAARRIHTPHALAFGAVCFLSTLLSLFFDADWPVIVSWIVAATVCILLEAGFLALFDPHLRAGPRAAYGYWLLIGCYTSAVMATEFAIGPPLLMLSEMLEGLVELAQHSAGLTDVFDDAVVQDDADAVICWIQIGVWIIALLCCQVARYRRRGADSLRLVLTVAVSAPLLLILYAFCVEQVGVRVYDAVGPSF
ncbi:MAG: hypothetical protein D6744_03660 [Planctomycetota bacterium]|nr:MAG: hypothetical protein D6744_03660 [Planctomycetota bacterium]